MMSEKSIKRTPALYLTMGFLVGVAIARNAETMAAPSKGAVLIGIILVGWFYFRAGSRGKNEAVAVAVATAIAEANAHAEAHAKAVANQAVQIVLNSGANSEGPRVIEDYTHSVIEQAEDIVSSMDFSKNVSAEKELA